MKKNIFITLAALVVIVVTSCSSGEKALEEKVLPMLITKETERKIDIIAKEGPLLGKIKDEGHIYVYFLFNQDKNCEILKLTNDLEIKGRYIIRRGVGPGEARNPRIYGSDARSIIVYDAPARKYIEFDPDFKLIDEYRLKDLGVFLYSGAGYIPEYRLVLDGFSPRIDYYEGVVRIYTRKLTGDKKTKDTKLFETRITERRKDNKKKLAHEPVHFGYFFDHIYILDKREYCIIKMDINGNVLKEKKIPFKSRNLLTEDRKKWIGQVFEKEWAKKFDYPEKLLPVSWMLPIAGGIAVARCQNYDLDEKGPIPADFFDPDLNYLGKITLPYFGAWNLPGHGQVALGYHVLYRNGKLYYSEDREGEYWITRWNVKIEKNKTK